jgi:hypothetical protein
MGVGTRCRACNQVAFNLVPAGRLNSESPRFPSPRNQHVPGIRSVRTMVPETNDAFC